MFNGYGLEVSTSLAYKGYFVDDMKYGHGIIKYANGDIYDGLFVADSKCGHAKYYNN